MAKHDDYVRNAIGPRQAGTIVLSDSGVSRVDEVLTGDAARERIPFAEFVIIETDLDAGFSGRVRMHCTAWDPKHKRILDSPIAVGSTCPLCADTSIEVVGSSYRATYQELTVWHPHGVRCVQAPVDRDGQPTSGRTS